MKKYRYLILFVFTLIYGAVCGQMQQKKYSMWILNTHGEKIEGRLHSYTDSSIIYHAYPYAINSHVSYPATEIQQVQFRKKGKVARGVLIGAAVGAFGGYLAAKNGANSSSRELEFDLYTNGTGAFLGAIFGAGIGVAIGTGKQRIDVYGSQERFDAYKGKMEPYLWPSIRTDKN